MDSREGSISLTVIKVSDWAEVLELMVITIVHISKNINEQMLSESVYVLWI
jgi:hypothetical protein